MIAVGILTLTDSLTELALTDPLTKLT